jgi:hypothetical protein
MRSVLMKAEDQEVCRVRGKKANDGIQLITFLKVCLQFHSLAASGLAGFGVQSFIGLLAILLNQQPDRRIGSVCIRHESG